MFVVLLLFELLVDEFRDFPPPWCEWNWWLLLRYVLVVTGCWALVTDVVAVVATTFPDCWVAGTVATGAWLFCDPDTLLVAGTLGLALCSPSLVADLGLVIDSVVVLALLTTTADDFIVGGVAVRWDVELDTIMEGVIALVLETETVALAIALITRDWGGGLEVSLDAVSVVSFEEEADECSDSWREEVGDKWSVHNVPSWTIKNEAKMPNILLQLQWWITRASGRLNQCV